MECNFSDPNKLPKNFAMLKVLERHQQAQVVSLVILLRDLQLRKCFASFRKRWRQNSRLRPAISSSKRPLRILLRNSSVRLMFLPLRRQRMSVFPYWRISGILKSRRVLLNRNRSQIESLTELRQTFKTASQRLRLRFRRSKKSRWKNPLASATSTRRWRNWSASLAARSESAHTVLSLASIKTVTCAKRQKW